MRFSSEYVFDSEDALEMVKEFIGPVIGVFVMTFIVAGTFSLFMNQQMSQLQSEIVADIHNPSIQVKLIGDTIVLEGTAADKSEVDRCEAIALDYLTNQKARFTIVTPKFENKLQVKRAA